VLQHYGPRLGVGGDTAPTYQRIADHDFKVFGIASPCLPEFKKLGRLRRDPRPVFPRVANCRSGLRVFGNTEGVLAGEAKGLKLLSEIVSELD